MRHRATALSTLVPRVFGPFDQQSLVLSSLRSQAQRLEAENVALSTKDTDDSSQTSYTSQMP